MVGDSGEQRQDPLPRRTEKQQQSEARERLDVKIEMRIGLMKNNLAILADMLSKEPDFESNRSMQSAYQQSIEMMKRIEQDKEEDVEKLLEEIQQFIREQQKRFLRKNVERLCEVRNSIQSLRKRFLSLPLEYDGNFPADEEVRNALRTCEGLVLAIKTRTKGDHPFATSQAVEDFVLQYCILERLYHERFLENYLQQTNRRESRRFPGDTHNIENTAVAVSQSKQVRVWSGVDWRTDWEHHYTSNTLSLSKNVTGYSRFLEELLIEFGKRPVILEGSKRADRTRRQEAILKDAKYAVKWQLAESNGIASRYAFIHPPVGAEKVGWSATQEGKLYHLTYAAQRTYIDENKRFAELLACVDEKYENPSLRDADMACEHALEAISLMSMGEAIAWVKRMGILIGENTFRSDELKQAHAKLFAACRETLLKKSEERRREAQDDPKNYALYQDECLQLALLFRTEKTIRKYNGPYGTTEYFPTLQEDLSDSAFADLMAARAMDFENLAYQYGMKELLHGNPLRAVIADIRPNVLRKIATLDQGVQDNPQVQEMITVINGDPETIEGLSAQYTVLRQMQEMLGNGTTVEMAAIQQEIEEKFGPHFKRCTEEFDKFLNQAESGASHADIERVTGVKLSEAQKGAYVLLADIRGHGWGNMSDETMQYIRIGTKIAVMIAAGVAVGFATAGLGVVGASIIGGTAMTGTGLLMNRQSFDSAEEFVEKVGPMWTSDTLGFGTGRLLSMGRTAAPLWRSGVISNYADLRQFFVTASRAGGQKALAQFDEAYSLGQRLLLTNAEGAADIAASTALDVLLIGGDFGERLMQNMMFLGLPVGMELRHGVWKHLQNATDEQLTLISRTMRDVQTENARLLVLCDGTSLQPQQVARMQNESGLMAALRSIETSQADNIKRSWQNIHNSRKVLRKQMGVEVSGIETQGKPQEPPLTTHHKLKPKTIDSSKTPIDALGKEVIFGKMGYRVTDKEANATYNKRGGWKLHITVDPKDYEIVDRWLFNNHKGQYKLLSGGDHADGKDFTVYIGSRVETDAMVRKMTAEIGQYLQPSTADWSDLLLTDKIAARFDIQTSSKGKALGLDQNYGYEGLPIDRRADRKIRAHGVTRDKIKEAGQQLRERIEPILEKEYGEFYSGKKEHQLPSEGTELDQLLRSGETMVQVITKGKSDIRKIPIESLVGKKLCDAEDMSRTFEISKKPDGQYSIDVGENGGFTTYGMDRFRLMSRLLVEEP